MSTETSCRKYLNAVANEILNIYDFETFYRNHTMADLQAAKEGREGDEWNYRKNLRGQHLTTVPLPSLFTKPQRALLKCSRPKLMKEFTTVNCHRLAIASHLSLFLIRNIKQRIM